MSNSSFLSFMAALRASLQRLRALARKELITLLRDPGMRRILVVPIIAQSILFGYGATFNLEEAPYVIYDASRSPASERVIRRIEANRIFVRAGVPQSYEAFEKAVNDGDALIGLYFPDDFARKLARGEPSEIFVAADARNTTTANVATGYVSAIIESIAREDGTAGPIEVRERYRYNENGITRWNIMTGLILGLAMIQVMLLAGLAVSREREEGSFDMMLMTPASSVEILIGKAVVPTIIACLQAFLIFLVGVFWFELPFAGSPLALGLLVFGFALSFVGLGLAISAVADTIQQAIVIVIFVMMPTIIFSGLFTSVLAMPQWMQVLSNLNPLRSAIIGLRMIYFEGASLMETVEFFWPAALAALISLALAARLFRNKIQ